MTDFDEQGFMVLRRLLSPKQVFSYRQLIDELTGEGGDLNYWEGVTREARFWPLIFEPVLLARLRELLGPDVRYLQFGGAQKSGGHSMAPGLSRPAFWHGFGLGRKSRPIPSGARLLLSTIL